MGQYYRAILGNDESTVVIKSEINGNFVGSKLMEQSWVGASLVTAVSELIYENPNRIAWVGDYAECENYTPSGQITLASKNSTAESPLTVDMVWGENINKIGLLKSDFNISDCFLINHDTKEYIDCNEYISKSTQSDTWCIHPLPLLTAVGNGLGGGDFYPRVEGVPENELKEMLNNVGIWAWNTLEFSKTSPKDYKKLSIWFKEEL